MEARDRSPSPSRLASCPTFEPVRSRAAIVRAYSLQSRARRRTASLRSPSPVRCDARSRSSNATARVRAHPASRVRHRVNTTASHTSSHAMSAAVAVIHQAYITSRDATIARTRVGKRKVAIFVETSRSHPRARENARGAREGVRGGSNTPRVTRAICGPRARGLARARTTDAVCGRRYISAIFEMRYFLLFLL